MKTIFLYLFLILPFILFSQDELYQSTRDDLNYGEFRPNNLAPRYGIAEKPGKLLGNIHLDTTFRKSAVVFFKDVVRRYDPDASDSISGYKMRINLLEKLVEFQIGDLVKEKTSTEGEFFEIEARYVNVDTERLVYSVVAWEGYDGYTFDEEDLELWDGEVDED